MDTEGMTAVQVMTVVAMATLEARRRESGGGPEPWTWSEESVATEHERTTERLRAVAMWAEWRWEAAIAGALAVKAIAAIANGDVDELGVVRWPE